MFLLLVCPGVPDVLSIGAGTVVHGAVTHGVKVDDSAVAVMSRALLAKQMPPSSS